MYKVVTADGTTKEHLFPTTAVLRALCDGGIVVCKSVKFAKPVKGLAEKYGGAKLTARKFEFKASSKLAVEFARDEGMLRGT